MKKAFFAGLLFVCGLGIVYLFLLWQKQTMTTVVKPPVKQGTPFTFSLDEAPKEALKTSAITSSGNVFWTSRTATEPARLQAGIQLQQGEELATDKQASVTFAFQDAGSVSVAAESKLEIVQTLPQNIVFRQTAGQATYVSGTSPVSVRAQHFIAVINGGTMEISLKDTGETIIKAIKGPVQIGFNDLDYRSITISLQEGDSYLYDDVTRTGEIE